MWARFLQYTIGKSYDIKNHPIHCAKYIYKGLCIHFDPGPLQLIFGDFKGEKIAFEDLLNQVSADSEEFVFKMADQR